MKYGFPIFLLCFASGFAVGQDFVRTPSEHTSSATYWTAVGAAAGFTAADAATTLLMIKPQNRCNIEAGSPMLYGRQPTSFRTIAIMGTTTAGAAMVSYKLRHDFRHGSRWLWLAPLTFVGAMHADGAIHNLMVCR